MPLTVKGEIMSMYNMLFGMNPYTPTLKWILKLDLPNGYSSGRFRDIYLNKDGTKITLYTRNGGGNRGCWDSDGCDADKNIHGSQCMISIIKRLQEHPNYLKDYDDGFDSTYAYFEFSVPENYLELTKALATGEDPASVSDKFVQIVEEVKNMPKEQLETDERFKPIVTMLKSLVDNMDKPA